MKKELSLEEKKRAQDNFRRAVAYAGSMIALSKLANISLPTIHRIKLNSECVGTYTVRAKIETFLEERKQYEKT